VQNLIPWLFMASLFALYAAAWLGMLATVAHLGGWSVLAKQFAVPALPAGKRFRFQSASFHRHWTPMNYGSCLTLVVCEQGLGLATGWLLRFRHPPLLIPWSEFRQPEQKRILWLFRYVVADVGEPAIVKLYLPHWTFAQANLAMAATDEPREG
jgi:hypothetical protein